MYHPKIESLIDYATSSQLDEEEWLQLALAAIDQSGLTWQGRPEAGLLRQVEHCLAVLLGGDGDIPGDKTEEEE